MLRVAGPWFLAFVAIAVPLAACVGKSASPPDGGAGASSSDTSTATQGGSGCPLDGSDLPGYVHTIDKTKFAFGGTPTAQVEAGFTRWVGPDGAWALSVSGYVLGSMNGGAPERNAAGWSNDSAATNAHVVAYFTGGGLESCQILYTGGEGGGGGGGPTDGGPGTTFTSPIVTELSRGIDKIPIAESLALSEFTKDDVSISESVYWPTIPGAVVSDARSWRDEIATPSGLAAYRAKLPSDVGPTGSIVIHHTMGTLGPVDFKARASYDVAPVASYDSNRSFDRNGDILPPL